jgi:hypothetical protein
VTKQSHKIMNLIIPMRLPRYARNDNNLMRLPRYARNDNNLMRLPRYARNDNNLMRLPRYLRSLAMTSKHVTFGQSREMKKGG